MCLFSEEGGVMEFIKRTAAIYGLTGKLPLVRFGSTETCLPVGLLIVPPATFKSYEDCFCEKDAQENWTKVEKYFDFLRGGG